MEENHQRAKNHQSISGNNAWSLHRANNGVCSQQQDLENLVIPGWSIHKGLATEVENDKPQWQQALNVALVPLNKA